MPSSSTATPRAVITGIGPVSVLGIGKEDFWERLSTRKRPLVSQVSGSCQSSCYRIRETIPCPLPEHRMKRIDRATTLALAAADLALKDSGIDDISGPRSAVTFGSALAGFSCAETDHEAFLDRGQDAIPLPFATRLIGASMPGHIAIQYNITGMATANADSCAAGNRAIAEALYMIRRGDADVVVAGAAEAPIAPLTASSLNRLKVMSTTGQCRPFADDRDGFILAEGAAALVIESEAHAKARGATIYAEILGYGATSEAHHMTTPHPSAEPVARAIQLTLDDAGVAPEAIDLVSVHGSATRQNDANELSAMKQVFGSSLPAIHAAKSQLGHSLGAASALEACLVALALHTGKKIDAPYEAPHLKSVDNPQIALNSAFGFGGIDTCLCLAKPRD